uniref:Uncharacterized protein n=1 Tax=Megaselia scalaris TaxID=36166 RepID=T1GXT6_MEGSC
MAIIHYVRFKKLQDFPSAISISETPHYTEKWNVAQMGFEGEEGRSQSNFFKRAAKPTQKQCSATLHMFQQQFQYSPGPSNVQQQQQTQHIQHHQIQHHQLQQQDVVVTSTSQVQQHGQQQQQQQIQQIYHHSTPERS